MKTKYTLQELKDKKIVIRCDSREEADRVVKVFEKELNEYSSYFHTYDAFVDNFISDFNLANGFNDRKIIPASEFFMETPEEKADKIIEKLDEKQLKLTPIEIHNIDLWLADIHCFVAGIIATQAEFESKFDILIDADRKLKDLRNKIKELL